MDSSGSVSRDYASVYDSGSPDYGFVSGNVTFGFSDTAAGEGSYRSTTVEGAAGIIGNPAAERAFVANLPEPDLAGFAMNVATVGSLVFGGELLWARGLAWGADMFRTFRAYRAARLSAEAVRFSKYKSAEKWASQMSKRGWSEKQIQEAILRGEKIPAVNNINKLNSATRHVHPATGRSVVIDDVTKEVIHVGGNGFKY